METKIYKYSYFWQGMLVGGFLGGLAGILFAPKSGKELRADLKEKGNEAVNEAKRAYSEAQNKAKTILGETERQLCEARQRAKEILACFKESKGKGAASMSPHEYAEEVGGEA